jgi:hypothetical protein
MGELWAALNSELALKLKGNAVEATRQHTEAKAEIKKLRRHLECLRESLDKRLAYEQVDVQTLLRDEQVTEVRITALQKSVL